MKIVLFVFSLFGLGSVLAQTNSPAMLSTSYPISSVNDSGISGNVWLGEYPFGTIVAISLAGTQAGNTYPAHLHIGNCGSGGGISVSLESVVGETGLGITVTDVPYTTLFSEDYYLNIHASQTDMGTILACTEIGANAEMNQITTPSSQTNVAEQTTTGVRSEEFETLETASYGIFEVAGSGINGQVQFTDEADGGTQIIVTLRGVQAGANFPMDIKSGDCGPDGSALLELNDFPLGLVDPDASMTETDMSISTFSEQNNYLTIYSKDGTVLACGEVGLGANR